MLSDRPAQALACVVQRSRVVFFVAMSLLDKQHSEKNFAAIHEHLTRESAKPVNQYNEYLLTFILAIFAEGDTFAVLYDHVVQKFRVQHLVPSLKDIG